MITFGNKKLKNSGKGDGEAVIVGAFSLPAQKTCPRAGECRKFCYASVGTFMFKGPREHSQKNWEKSQSPYFVCEMIAEINGHFMKALKKGARLIIRLHDSGDFYSKEYAEKWRLIMQAFPTVEFYAYSKSWLMAKDVFKDVPNMTIIPSMSGLDDELLIKSGYPFAYVFPEKGEPLVNTVEGSEDDLINLANIKKGKSVGLRAHGVRKGKVA